jgi:hypothetical protein
LQLLRWDKPAGWSLQLSMASIVIRIATDPEQLLQLLRRWEEAETAGRMIKRIAVAYEVGCDGFLAGTLAARRWGRGLGHPFVERPGLARAPAEARQRPLIG